MASNTLQDGQQDSNCACHKWLFLGADDHDDQQFDLAFINWALRTHALICRNGSQEQARASMNALQLVIKQALGKDHEPKSVFPHDCVYLKKMLFAKLHSRHPLYSPLNSFKNGWIRRDDLGIKPPLIEEMGRRYDI